MLAQIATLVCAAAMALSLSVEASSFFHSSPRASPDGDGASSVHQPTDPAAAEADAPDEA